MAIVLTSTSPSSHQREQRCISFSNNILNMFYMSGPLRNSLHTHTHSHSQSYTYILTLTFTFLHTHTYTDTLILTHSHSHTLTFCNTMSVQFLFPFQFSDEMLECPQLRESHSHVQHHKTAPANCPTDSSAQEKAWHCYNNGLLMFLYCL